MSSYKSDYAWFKKCAREEFAKGFRGAFVSFVQAHGSKLSAGRLSGLSALVFEKDLNREFNKGALWAIRIAVNDIRNKKNDRHKQWVTWLDIIQSYGRSSFRVLADKYISLFDIETLSG